MLDMSKAIDTVKPKLLINHFEKILEPVEKSLLSVLINETTLQIKVDKHLSEKIQTNTGFIQDRIGQREYCKMKTMKLFKFFLKLTFDCSKYFI